MDQVAPHSQERDPTALQHSVRRFQGARTRGGRRRGVRQLGGLRREEDEVSSGKEEHVELRKLLFAATLHVLAFDRITQNPRQPLPAYGVSAIQNILP